ncbi:uncharacterized protein A4U43_C03F25480 [Asparagus officinalis]|uniref:BRCT domain-containing protein n=1 Tax=Asparagus officinalis TaxID=4686 RepID=A0A5P1FHX0_ASPOF|nr:uncharacterized protein A4U43_C03F25480 [Asparagus officinalis]
MSDIRKWFIKQHDKGNGSAAPKPTKPPEKPSAPSAVEKPVERGQERRKTSKYFANSDCSKEQAAKAVKDEVMTEKNTPAKRKTTQKSGEDVKPTPVKKIRKVEEDDDDFEPPSSEKKKAVKAKPPKKPIVKKSVVMDESDDDNEEVEEKEVKTPTKSGGRGRGGRGSGAGPAASAGRGRGGGGREVPEGAPECLAGLTFVISGTLDSLEREEAEDLIKRHGGRVTGSVSKKTVADEDIGGKKSAKAKELGTKFLTEDELFDMIRKSKPAKAPVKEDLTKKHEEKENKSHIKSRPMKVKVEGIMLGVFEDNRFKSESKKASLKSVDIIGFGSGPYLDNKLKFESDVCSGVIFGKELVNAPANVLTPGALADETFRFCSDTWGSKSNWTN